MRSGRARAASEADDAVHELCRSLDGLPLAIELAAARTKTLSIEEITRRLDDRFSVLSDPTSRRPERRRALKSTIRWSYDLLFPDDQRGLWALATFAGGAPLPAVESVLEALDVPAAAAIDVVGRLASRSLVIVDDDGAPTTVRYRLLDSIRAFALEAMADAGLSERALAAHAAWFADAARSSTQGVRSSRPGRASRLRPGRARQHRRRVGVEHRARPAARARPRQRVRLGLGRPRRQPRRATDPRRTRCGRRRGPVRDRANALLLAAWIEASTGRLDLARDHIAAATDLADTINDVDLQARCCYYLAYVVSHHGEFRDAMELTDRSAALYAGLDRPWDQAANWLFAARAAISAGDEERSVEAVDHVQHWLRTVDDPWLHVRRDAMLGELARIQHRFDDAVAHLGRAAETSRTSRLPADRGVPALQPRTSAVPGRRLRRRFRHPRLAIDKAEATGDVRLAALARVHLGRVLRALGQVARARAALEAAAAWHRAAGGGEQAALGECLLAAMDAADRIPGAEERLVAILDDARPRRRRPRRGLRPRRTRPHRSRSRRHRRGTRPLRATADRRMEAAAHFITDLDRTDAHAVRQIA